MFFISLFSLHQGILLPDSPCLNQIIVTLITSASSQRFQKFKVIFFFHQETSHNFDWNIYEIKS